MVTARIGSFFLFAAGLWAANINIVLTGVTPTQAVLTYSAPNPNPCTIALSESSTLTPLVHDLDPVLFPGSSSDTRPGGMSNGVARTIVLGKRSVERGADGRSYSRALQAYTQHFLSVVCGADSGTTVFRTENPPLGNNAPEVPLFDATSFGNYAQPTIDFLDQSVTYVDPLTGVLLKRATSPGAFGDLTYGANSTFSSVADIHSAWTAPSSILGTSGFAAYGGAGTTADSLFLVAPVSLPGSKGYSTHYTVIDLRLRLNGSGTDSSAVNRTMSACLSTDHGQTCAGAVVDLPAFFSASPAVIQFPATYPNPVFALWTAAGGTPVSTPNIQTRTGNVTVTGQTVTLNSGDTFQEMAAGDIITITGSGCPNGDQCVIASVLNSNHLTITTSASITANYTAGNFGVKLWKKTATGTVTVNSARFDWTNAVNFAIQVSGGIDNCSSLPAVTTVDRNGNTLSGPQSGFLCTQEDQWGNARLYWHGTNGEVRHLSNLTRPAVSAPPADAISFSDSLCIVSSGDPVGDFDLIDPNSLYCAGTQTGGGKYDVVYKCTYNSSHAVWGNYREWNNNFDSTTENPAESCVNITKASLGNDLESQLPGIDSSYFFYGPGAVKGRYFTLVARHGYNGLGYFIRFDTVTQRVVFSHDSWSTFPRWGGVHGSAGNVTPNYGELYLVPLVNFKMPLVSIDGLGSTALASAYNDTRTCQALGVSDPTFIAEGATGNVCIAVTVAREPYDSAPTATDLAKFPDPSNAASCGGDGSTTNCWAKLQNTIEGDYIIDAGTNGYYEQFRIVKKISSTRLILQRGASTGLTDCTVAPRTDHAAGWNFAMWMRGSCGAGAYYFDTSGNVLLDSASMTCCHGDWLTDNTTDIGTAIQSDYDIRAGDMASKLGKPADFHSYGSYSPTFAGSSASLSPGFIQSHPSARQHNALPAERRWALDGRPYGGEQGGSALLFYNSVTATGTANVYKVTAPTSGPNGTGAVVSGMDRKRIPLHVWAGKNLLRDKSGPGSVLAATDLWNYCVVDFAGECAAGSSKGDVYMNVPQADTSGTCQVQFEINTPCWTSASPPVPFITQFGIDRPDASGLYWRRVSTFLNGIGGTDNFWNARSLPDASWIFTASKWLNGYRTEIMMAKLPPWPADDTIQRGTFIPVTVQINGNSQRTYRARFGYDTNLYCTTRQEQCATVASGNAPFQWVSEQLPWQNCNGPCQLSIPAVSGRVLYYVVDALDANGTLSSTPMNVYPVP